MGFLPLVTRKRFAVVGLFVVFASLVVHLIFRSSVWAFGIPITWFLLTMPVAWIQWRNMPPPPPAKPVVFPFRPATPTRTLWEEHDRDQQRRGSDKRSPGALAQ